MLFDKLPINNDMAITYALNIDYVEYTVEEIHTHNNGNS